MSHKTQVRRVAAVVAGIVVAATAVVPVTQASPTPNWKQALAARSVALDRQYGLGRFAVPASVGTTTPPAWLTALELRGQAMNAKYHLGVDRVPTSHVGFDWGDAGIGAAASAALLLLLASIAYAGRGRSRLARVS
jgi:hypothetical protein